LEDKGIVGNSGISWATSSYHRQPPILFLFIYMWRAL
jgi:hypothetical protein